MIFTSFLMKEDDHYFPIFQQTQSAHTDYSIVLGLVARCSDQIGKPACDSSLFALRKARESRYW